MRLTLIDRYIAQHIVVAFLIVLLVVAGLMGLSTLLDEVGDVNAYYQLPDAIRYVLLSLPALCYQLIPMSALIGTLIGLGVLASNSELTVMRASGVSLPTLIFAVVKPVALIALLTLLMSEYLIPPAQQAAQSGKALAEARSGRIVASAGAWYRQDEAFVHITTIDSNGDLIGVTQHRFNDEHRLVETLSAQRAVYDEASGWSLLDGSRTELDMAGQALKVEAFQSLPWSSDLSAELLAVILVQPADLPISGLYTYSGYLESQGVNPGPYRLAFWNKLLQPLSIIVLVMVGVASVFGPLRSVTVGQRILTGVIVGVVFKFSQDLLSPASQVLGFPALLAVLTPILVTAAIALLLLRRVR